MRNAGVNGVGLESEVIGSCEPLLLISPVLAEGFLPPMFLTALVDRTSRSGRPVGSAARGAGAALLVNVTPIRMPAPVRVSIRLAAQNVDPAKCPGRALGRPGTTAPRQW